MPAFEDQLAVFLTGRVCVLGFGNRIWRDDGAGSIVAEALQATQELDAIDGGFVPENHLEVVVRKRPDSILLIDAADFGGHPGEIRLLDHEALISSGISTHAGSPQLLAQYLENRCHARVALLAIQPADSSAGSSLSPAVSRSVTHLINVLPELCRA